MAEVVRAPSLSELNKRKSYKWRQHSSEIIPLPVAEMDFIISDAIKNSLRDMIDRSDTGYLGAFPELFEAFAGFAQNRWNWNVDVKHVRIAPDVGLAAVEVMRTLMSPGDKVMLNSPVYDNMWKWVAEVKATLIDVPLLLRGEVGDDATYSLDLERIESEYKAGVKVHLLCHPHNPVGAIMDRDSLSNLASLAKKYGVYIISDEIFGSMVFDRSKYVPFQAISEDAKEVSIAVTSASKGFNLAGLKCALIVT
ncbi:MAG: aminotransferase class I/II-fold pyridoxal phosphate-dependent enzyme, partial [Actinomycetota bacterium]